MSLSTHVSGAQRGLLKEFYAKMILGLRAPRQYNWFAAPWERKA